MKQNSNDDRYTTKTYGVMTDDIIEQIMDKYYKTGKVNGKKPGNEKMAYKMAQKEREKINELRRKNIAL